MLLLETRCNVVVDTAATVERLGIDLLDLDTGATASRVTATGAQSAIPSTDLGLVVKGETAKLQAVHCAPTVTLSWLQEPPRRPS